MLKFLELNMAYSSTWDNIVYPIFQFSDLSYLCICYSKRHETYYLTTTTNNDMNEQGCERDINSDYLFENITSKELTSI